MLLSILRFMPVEKANETTPVRFPDITGGRAATARRTVTAVMTPRLRATRPGSLRARAWRCLMDTASSRPWRSKLRTMLSLMSMYFAAFGILSADGFTAGTASAGLGRVRLPGGLPAACRSADTVCACAVWPGWERTGRAFGFVLKWPGYSGAQANPGRSSTPRATAFQAFGLCEEICEETGI